MPIPSHIPRIERDGLVVVGSLLFGRSGGRRVGALGGGCNDGGWAEKRDSRLVSEQKVAKAEVGGRGCLGRAGRRVAGRRVAGISAFCWRLAGSSGGGAGRKIAQPIRPHLRLRDRVSTSASPLPRPPPLRNSIAPPSAQLLYFAVRTPLLMSDSLPAPAPFSTYHHYVFIG